MKIRNKLKKILALTLALSMSVGMLHIPTETNLVNAATVEDKEFACTISPASNTDTDPQITYGCDSVKVKLKEKAAPTEVTIEGLSLDHDYLWPKKNGYWNIWQIYLNTDVNLPADKTFNVTLRDNTTETTAEFRYSSTNIAYMKIEGSFLPENAAKTFTIKAGTYEATDGSCSIAIKDDYSIHVEGGVWSQAGTKPTLEGVESFTSISFGCAWDHSIVIGDNNDGFYVYSTTDDGIVISGSWDDDTYLTPVLVDETKKTFYGSSTWYAHTDDTEENRRSEYKTTVKIKKFSKEETGYSYFVNLGQVPAEGDIVRFGGYYKDPKTNKIYYFTPIKVKFVTGTDGELTCIQLEKNLTAEYAGTLTIKGGAHDVYGADYKTSELYFSSTDNYAYGFGKEKWNVLKLDVANSEGSITLDGNKITNVALQKYSYRYNTTSNRWDNLYYLSGLSGVETNSVLTIDGKFKDGNKTITFNKSQFKWDGNKWMDVATTNGTLTTTIANGAETDSTDSKGNVYLKGTDTYLNNRTYNEWVTNDARLVAANDDSGVFVGDTRVSATLIKYSGKNNWYYLECVSADISKVLTVKGTFMTDNGIPAVNIEDSSFHWDGTKWVDGGLTTETTISGFNSNIEINSWFYPTDTDNGWRVYFTTSELPGTGNEKYELSFSDGTNIREVSFNRDAKNNVIYGYIPKDLVDNNKKYTLTLKANEYYAYSGEKKLDYGINIKNDVNIYISEYGWSFNSSEIKPDKKISRSFILDENKSNTDTEKRKNGFYVTLSEYDGVSVAANDWNGWNDNNRIMAMNSDSTTYYSAGIYKNGNNLKQINTGFNKLDNDTYYISVLNADGEPTSVGDTYVIKGLFKNPADDSTIEYRPLTVKWTENGWEQLYTELIDTDVKYDINSDYAANIKDLVALKIYLNDNMYSINKTQADIDGSGSINVDDADRLRMYLAGAWNVDEDGTISGIPTYNAERTFNKAAYGSVKIGEWNTNTSNMESYLSETEVDNAMQKYKAAGLNLLLNEGVAGHVIDTSKNEGIKKYLEAAERNGLGVIVSSEWLFGMAAYGPETYATNHSEKKWQTIIDDLVIELRGYSAKAFKGLMIADEVLPDGVQPESGEVKACMDNYVQVANYIATKYPELIIHASQMPVTSKKFASNDKDTEYKKYVNKLTTKGNNMFTFDMYPLKKQEKKGNFSGNTSYSLSLEIDEWFKGHELVADVCKAEENNYNFNKGVTIQSCQERYASTKEGVYTNTDIGYAPTFNEDIGFQVFTSMAYGVKEINFWTYDGHHNNTAITESIADNEDVYRAVQTINGQVDNFANVYLAYDWRDTFDIADKATYYTTATATDNGRLKSASVSGARTLIGHMKDVEGFDGYMIANAAAPRTGVDTIATNATEVKLNFNKATKAVVYDYKAGTRKVVDLTDGTLTVTVNVGEGTFVIPVK